MKFKINRDHFSSGLQLLTSVVGARKTMPILLMLSDDINLEMASSTLNISINEKVYFYQVNSKTLVESYVINNVRVKQKLGEIHFWISN